MKKLISAIKEKLGKFFGLCSKVSHKVVDVFVEYPIVFTAVKAVYYGVSFLWVVPAVVGSCFAMATNATILEDVVWVAAGGLMFAYAGLPGLWFVVLLPCFFGWLANTLLVVEWVVTEALRVQPCSPEEL